MCLLLLLLCLVSVVICLVYVIGVAYVCMYWILLQGFNKDVLVSDDLLMVC